MLIIQVCFNGMIQVACIQAAKKKAYLLFGLEPDRSLTGGSFYSGQEFDSEFVDVLNSQCYRFLEEKVARDLIYISVGEQNYFDQCSL